MQANAELGKLGLDLTDWASACVRAAARAREQICDHITGNQDRLSIRE